MIAMFPLFKGFNVCMNLKEKDCFTDTAVKEVKLEKQIFINALRISDPDVRG